MKIVLVLLIAASSIVGQQPTSAIKVEAFSRQYRAGWKVMGVLAKQGLRFIETRGDWVLIVEADRKGATRASYVHTASGVVDSECIVIGENIYERRGKGPWTLRTRAEYKAEMEVLREALNKALAEKDSQAHERLRAEGNIEATISAFNSQHVPWFSSGILSTVLGDGILGRVITETGRVTLKGQTVRQYKATGIYKIPELRVREGARKNHYDYDFWFDDKTGAIVKARARNDLIGDYRTVTNVVLSEWELDPLIEIKAPAVISRVPDGASSVCKK